MLYKQEIHISKDIWYQLIEDIDECELLEPEFKINNDLMEKLNDIFRKHGLDSQLAIKAFADFCCLIDMSLDEFVDFLQYFTSSEQNDIIDTCIQSLSNSERHIINNQIMDPFYHI